MHSITKKYITIGTKKVFVQILGTGPAMALLHPSPHSSDMLLPFAKKLSSHYTVICIDTPGYGRSDGLDEEPKDISVYSELLHQVFKAMHIKKISIYGSATGAQIGIRYALDHPKKVSHLFLDNTAHFDDDLRNKILDHYFPDLTPTQDGSHLITLWDIVSNMFKYFPWCLKTPEYALNRPPLPAEALHAIAMDYLKAGEQYDYAYRVAFIHEQAKYVQQLNVDTSIFNWKGSIIYNYVERLLSFKFSNNIKTITIDYDSEDRLQDMVSYMDEETVGLLNYTLPRRFGLAYTESPYLKMVVSPPDISLDGSYLLKAWKLLMEQHKDASLEAIQKALTHWYAK